MDNRHTILKEIQEISPVVAAIGCLEVFRVPGGYFESFPGAVLARIHSENAELGPTTAVFTVPKGYFDGLADNILERIKLQESKDLTVEKELNELAPILNTISKKPVYSVPEGYFESLELTIPLKLDKPSAKVFSFGKPRRILQYAIAACTAGVLMVGAYLYTGNNNNDAGAEISYTEAVKMDVPEEIAELNEQDIASYLEQSPGIGYAINTSSTEDINLDEYIKSASDEEIKQYLNETVEPGENLINGS